MYLNCHTYYSFRYGTFSEEELLRLAHAQGVPMLALTDINNTSACLNFIRLAPKYAIKPIVGIDFRTGVLQHFIGIAHNNQGFEELNQFLSYHKHNNLPFSGEAPPFEHCSIIYPFTQVEKLEKILFKENEYIGIRPQDLNRLSFSKWKSYTNKCVVMQSVSFRSKSDFNTHRLMRAIDQNTLLSKLQKEEQGVLEEQFISPEAIKNRYADFPHILKNTEALMERCHIVFDFSPGRPSQNIRTYTGDAMQDKDLLLKLCKEGLPYRYPKKNKEVEIRVKKELDLIEQMNFVSFFLVNWDIVTYAKHKDFYHVGRGSGANSIIAYLLGITNVDPIELDLYFERFLNIYRANPPDFDIDFSTWDRPEMTRYIFDRFGKNGQAALLGAYSTFQYSAAVRELGKVFGLPKHEIDILSDGKYQMHELDELPLLVVRYAQRLHDMPNYLTVHAAGILISDKPIHYFSATEMPPKGFPTVQFDMHIAEDVGLHKFDILGQRGLGKIKETLSIIAYNQPHAPHIDIHNAKAFMVDENVNALIKSSNCIGCFYVESPAMRTLIKKLEVDNYLTLVAASSIIRPGVSQSGMMREYILRHRDPERRKQAHKVMWDIMPDTYGIMVYQEDVIKVAHYFAGLTLGEADVLRRGMSGKYRSREEFQQVRQKFIDNCKVKGYDDALVMEVWTQIESFAGYAFAKGHSASYAVESYQALFLKTYYPLEYMVAVLNNGGGFYRTEFYVHEARMQGAHIEAPCINRSEWATCIEGRRIFLGFGLLSGMEKKVIDRILSERKLHGVYLSFHDLLERVPIPFEQLDILIRIDAFRFSGDNKRKLLWNALIASRYEVANEHQQVLFPVKHKTYVLPDLNITDMEKVFDQIELLGFPLCNPFELGKEMHLQPQSSVKDMEARVNKSFAIVGYLVTIKNISTSSKKERMNFGTFIDREGHWLDTVHFPDVARRYPFRGKGLYRLQGMVKNEFGVITLEVSLMEKLPMYDDPRFTEEKIGIAQPETKIINLISE